MSDPVKISVILPVYNVEKYVGEAIQSILNQTYKNFELIILNDGSTDNSDAVIRSFSDLRIVYINNKENLGVIKGPNLAIKQARGQYIARMDADDVALPERLELQLKVLEQHKDAVVVSSDHYVMTGDKLKYMRNKNRSDELKATLLFSPCFAHPTVMMKNIAKEKNLFYDESARCAEDYKLWMDLSSYGNFYNVDKPLLKYRSHPAQVSNIHNKVQRETSARLRKYYLEKNGFVFSEEELRIHNFIGNNILITKFPELESIEKWLYSLLKQNEQIGAFDKGQFAAVMNKFWYDSCGYTSLGLKAYHFYFGSEIVRNLPVSFSDKMKLMAKCLIRKFRN